MFHFWGSVQSVFIVLLVVFSVFGEFSFQFISTESLFKEGEFDPYAFKSSLGVFYYPKEEDAKLKIRYLGDKDGNLYYHDFLIRDKGCYDDKTYLYPKFSLDVSLCHLKFEFEKLPLIETQIALKGYFDTLFYLGGSTPCFGFDGSYLGSVETRIAEKYSFRVGFHHISGHYGDDAIASAKEENESKRRYETGLLSIDDFFSPTQYVRDNELMVGVSADLLGFTPYFLASCPLDGSWTRPFIHNPAYNSRKNDDLMSGERVPDEKYEDYKVQFLAETGFKDSSYLCMRISAGCDWRKDFEKFSVYAGFNVQAYQDGQTEHQTQTYTEGNPWDVDYTAGIGFEFANLLGTKKLAFEVYDHYGRLPIANFYYERGNYISIGVVVK